MQQRELTPQKLADFLKNTSREALLQRAIAAKSMQKTEATADIVAACEELAQS